MTLPEETARIRRALISPFDKTGAVQFARGLSDADVEVVSTGNTARLLKSENVPVIDVSELTGFPEIMDGRVKTLHPKVHGGILGVRDDDNHKSAMRIHQIPAIDLVAVNLYPFEETVRSGAGYDEVIENIDIGGPAMIRSAAKNHAFVTVIVDPADYELVLSHISADGQVPLDLRKQLAAKAFARTAAYDAAISNWFAETLETPALPWRSFSGALKQEMRYGENPHQWAAFYVSPNAGPGVATAQQVQGKQLSYINILDANAAFELVAEFAPERGPACAIVKHANPCGVATGQTLAEAYDRALACDPVSRFGGIIAFNWEIDASTAEEIVKLFTEVVIAPSATEQALKVFETKKNIRVLLTGEMPDPGAEELGVRSVNGGLLVQSPDNRSIVDVELNIVTKRHPTETEMDDLRIAEIIAKHVKSNAVVYVKNGATVGIGAGQMSRVDSTRIAHIKSKDAAKAAGEKEALTAGSVMASDAFFPFADGLEAAIEAGATAVIQPGGSMRDDEVIAAADKAGIAMVMTGLRHFRH